MLRLRFVNGAGSVFVLHNTLLHIDSIVVFEQPMRLYEVHMRKRALAQCMSLNPGLGENVKNSHFASDVLKSICEAFARSTDCFKKAVPRRKIM
jgi:hypothetical protein